MAKPRLVILAGPNGAGKTTASRSLLKDALGIGEFVNADAIATGLSAFSPQSVAFEAGRIMLRRVNELIDAHASFAFETTLSSRTLVRLVRRAQGSGYAVDLIYLALPSAEIAKQRVAARVRAGGHDIPELVIERRYFRSLLNLMELYLPIVTRWKIFDNYTVPPTLVAQGTRARRTIASEQKWQDLVELGRQHPRSG